MSVLGGLGPLEIQMYADVARLRSDMEQAKAAVKGATDFMGSAFAAVGVSLSAAAFGSWIKGAIDAADEASKMAQKIGTTTDKVAGLQLAFEQSGAGGAEGMQKAMAKLSSEIIKGNDTLAALGITTKDSREALGQLADKFAGMADGTTKTAAAVDVFGAKLGANMIPLLNAGGDGLREMDELARKLGLTIDAETGKQAEKFNDTLDSLGKVSRGFATQAAAQLLPTLNDIAGAFLRNFTEGERLQGGVQVLDTGLKILFSTVAGGIEVFNTLGKSIGGVGAVAVQLLQGNFSGALEAAKAVREDIGEGWAATADTIRKAWDGSASDVALKSAEMAKQQRDAAAAADELQRKLLAQSEAAKKAAAEMKKLADAENERLSRRGLAELKRYDEATAEDARLTAEYRKAVQQELEIRAMQDLARQRRVDLAEEEADKKYEAEREAARKANADILADWQRTVDQMGQSFTDALMTGGKSVADYLKGLFRTLVLRPILMPAATAFSAAISGPAAAMGGASGAAGSAGGLLNLGGALAGIGSFGTAAGAGISATLAGGSLGGILSGAGAMMGQGTMAGIAGGAGLGIGAIAPYVLGAVALYQLGKKAFGRELKDTGITGTFNADTGDFTGRQYKFYKGGWLRSDKTTTSTLNAGLDATFDAGAKAMRATVQSYVDVLGLPAEAMKGYTQKIKFSIQGQSAKETQAEIERFVAKFGDGLAAVYKVPLAQFQKAGESVADTLERLAGLQTFSNTLADLGGVFQRLAGLSVDAREGFIAMAGGMDALGTKALQFVQDYYGRDEIAGIKAAEIKDALAAVGITQDVNSRDDFRRLVDGLDVSTQQGQEQLAALLDMASAFTSVADYLAETGATLSGAAALSPSGGNAAALFGQGGQGELLLATNNVGFWTEAVYNAIVAQTAVITSGSAAPAPAQQRPAPEVNGGNSGGGGGSMWQDGVYYGV